MKGIKGRGRRKEQGESEEEVEGKGKGKSAEVKLHGKKERKKKMLYSVLRCYSKKCNRF